MKRIVKYVQCLLLWSFSFFTLVHATSHLAYADTKAKTEKGKRLVINISCLHRLSIGTRSTLEGRIQIISPLPKGLQVSTDAKGTLHLNRTTCPAGEHSISNGIGNEDLALMTAPHMPIFVQNAGNASITIDPHLDAPVAVHVGNGAASLGDAEELDIFSNASGPITLPLLTTSARIRSIGSAVITIQHVKAKALFLILGGSSRFIAKTGKIKALEIISKSSGNAVFHGQSGVTALHVLSTGNITVDRVRGSLATERDGPGKIFYTSVP